MGIRDNFTHISKLSDNLPPLLTERESCSIGNEMVVESREVTPLSFSFESITDWGFISTDTLSLVDMLVVFNKKKWMN